jgi:hypothetical protein
MTRPPKDLDLKLVCKALDEIGEERFTDTIFYHVMGEATLYPHLEEVIRYTKKKNLKAVLTTNGWGLTHSLLERLLDADIDHIIFSAQTPNKSSFDLRNAPTDFISYKKKVCSLIAKIIQHGSTKATLSFLTTFLSYFLLPSNKYYIIRNKKELVKSFTEWLEEIALSIEDKVLLRSLHKNKVIIGRKLLSFSTLGWNKLNVTKQLTLETRVLGDWVHRGLYAEKIRRGLVGYCEGLKTHFGILSNGNMVFCCVDFDGKTAFANIKETSIKEALLQKDVVDVVNGFNKFKVINSYCQRCLGDVYFEKSVVRQIGSIFYFKVYRPWYEKRRENEQVLLCS